MKVNPGIFKAYDIRGIYPTDLNEAAAYAIGRAFVTFLAADQVLVGRDMRLSGPQIFDAVTRGIMDQGADVINIGMVSTDQFYFACSEKQLPGMMVTASHNPKEYSGFKMVRQLTGPLLENFTAAGKQVCQIDAAQSAAFAAKAKPDVPAMKGWRRELFGEAALKLKAGKLGLIVRDGEVRAVEL